MTVEVGEEAALVLSRPATRNSSRYSVMTVSLGKR